MDCGFCGRYTRSTTCRCGRSENEVIGLGAAAGAAAVRLCQALASAGTTFDDVRSAVDAAAGVLDGEGAGRFALMKLSFVLEGEIESALSEAWGYRRADVTLWGEPLGAFELPAFVFGRTTRRVDRHDGVIAFTIVEDPATGAGFVGVWALDGELLWAPPQARDLRFDGDAVELLFDSWRERREWPSGELLERRPASIGSARNLRFTIAEASQRVAILVYEDAHARTSLWLPDGAPEVDEVVARGAPSPVDAVFAADESFVVVLTGADPAPWQSPDPSLKEYRAATVSYYSVAHAKGAQSIVWAPLPDVLPPLLAAQILEAPVIVDDHHVRVRLPQGTVIDHALEPRHLAPAKVSSTVHWTDVVRPRSHAARRRVFGDFGRPLLAAEVEMPESVDFAPNPVSICARSADGLIAFTLRPRVGPEPGGLGVHHFPAGGDGVSAIWDEATGALVHVFDEPGVVQWLADDVVLVFHRDSLEALRWPTRERLWRIPLVSPLRGEADEGVPVSLAIATAKNLAVAVWERSFLHRSAPFFGYTLVDLGPRPAQRLGSACAVQPRDYSVRGELTRGPTWAPDDRLLVFSVGQPGWFRSADGFRGPGLDVVVGRLHVHDVVTDEIAHQEIRARTPADFAPPEWLGSDVVGPARFHAAREVNVDLPIGGTWSFDLALASFAPLPPRTTATPPRPRVTVTCGEADRRSVFPVPLEVPFALANAQPWARRVSWSEGLDRLALTLAPEGERGATLLCGVWDPRTGDLLEHIHGDAVAIGPWGSTIAVLADWNLEGFAWTDRSPAWKIDAELATDFAVGRWQGTLTAALVEENRDRLHVVNVFQPTKTLSHTTRRTSTFRGPCWIGEGRFVVIAAFAVETGASGELIVIDAHLLQVRETALPDDLAATTLDVTVDGVRLGTKSWRLSEIAPAPGVPSHLPTLLVIPRLRGFDAFQDADFVSADRLRAQGATIVPGDVAQLVEDIEGGIDPRLEELFAPSPLAEAAVLTIPFLVAFVADGAVPGRGAVVAFLVRVGERAQEEADDPAIRAFRASRDWLVEAVVASPELEGLLAM